MSTQPSVESSIIPAAFIELAETGTVALTDLAIHQTAKRSAGKRLLEDLEDLDWFVRTNSDPLEWGPGPHAAAYLQTPDGDSLDTVPYRDPDNRLTTVTRDLTKAAEEAEFRRTNVDSPEQQARLEGQADAYREAVQLIAGSGSAVSGP